MKHILIVAQIVLISIGLFGRTTVDVKFSNDKLFIMERGRAQGIEVGMKGKAQVVLKSSLDENEYPTDVGIFIVKKVNETSSELLLEKNDPNLEIKTINRVEFNPTAKEIESYIVNKSYIDAGMLLEQALKEDPVNAKLVLLKAYLDLLLTDEITMENCLDFKSRYPDAVLLKDIVGKLPRSGQKCIDDIMSVTINQKKYYEATFNNSHVMIFVPDMKLFIDKYEVSADQVRKTGIPIRPVKFFSLNLQNYPIGCPDYPAIVSFDEAERSCAATGMRLPTEEEWEYIAGKSKGFAYSWGNKEVNEDYNTYRANYESFDDGFPELAPVKVKEFEDYPSPCGAMNMMGNVSEWVKESYNKGGGFLTEKEDLKISEKSTDSICVGFRCVREAK